MAKWIEIEMVDDDDSFSVRDAIVCSECYWDYCYGIRDNIFGEAPENYKELKYCPVCGALMDGSDTKYNRRYRKGL